MNFGREPIISVEKRETPIKIENTAGFDSAIKKGKLDEAEVFLKKVEADVDNPEREFPQYSKEWVGQQEAKLFRAHREAGNREDALRFTYNAESEQATEGRLRNLDHLEAEEFRTARNSGDLTEAVAISLKSVKESSMEGRLRNLKDVFGKESVEAELKKLGTSWEGMME